MMVVRPAQHGPPGSRVPASSARRAIVRGIVGSEATNPQTAGSARNSAASSRCSPPIATVIARSSSTFAGSCIANGRRHGASAADNSRPRPDARIACVSNTPPA